MVSAPNKTQFDLIFDVYGNGDTDMSLALETLSEAFPTFEVITETRPGGGLRLTLKSGDETVLQRAIPAAQCTSKMHLEWVVSAIRRDLALEAGVPPSIINLQSQSRVRLPTYS